MDYDRHNQEATFAQAAPEPRNGAVRRRGVAPAPHQAMRLASQLDGKSKAEVRAALKAAGFSVRAEDIDHVLTCSAEIPRLRSRRRANSIARRIGHVPTYAFDPQRRAPVLLPVGTPRQRLDAKRRSAIAAAARRLFRHGAAGGSSMRIGFASTASKVNYVVNMYSNRDTYRGAFKGWAANEDHHLIDIPQDWLVRVQRRGLAMLGGMLTLDLHPLEAAGDVRVYAATWARQGRGYEVHLDRGYIAILLGEHYHAKTAERAIVGVRRKAKLASQAVRARFEPYEVTVEAFVERYKQSHLVVTLDDARDTGSCEFGIRSWCESIGLSYENGSAPLQQVLQGFRTLPQVEVRRVVVHAVRRHRAAQRKRRVAGQTELVAAF